jgi:hypothetical protein
MGGVTELVGIDASFYWTGGIALALFALAGWRAARVERAGGR